MIKITCGACGQPFEVEDAMAGSSGICPACHKSVPTLPPGDAVSAAKPPSPGVLPVSPHGALPKYVRQVAATVPPHPAAASSCPACGSTTAAGVRFCPACGAQTSGQVSTRESTPLPGGERHIGASSDWCYPCNPPKSPHIAWLNIIGGAGIAQVVHGQVKKGVALVIASNVSAFIGMVGGNPLFTLIFFALLIVTTVDAFMLGKALWRGKPVRQFGWFPRSE